jgi:predicted MPP superfamily phosphohydrolase
VFACLLGIAAGVPLLLTKGILRFGRALFRRRAVPQAESVEGRRQFLGNVALPVMALSLGGVGAVGGASSFILAKREIFIRGWPKNLDGFRIGQITDTHVGDFIDPETVARAVEVLNHAQVDLQVMTGDLVDDLKYLDKTFQALDTCLARHGMLAVLGNHEKMHHRLVPMLEGYARRRSAGHLRLLVDESEVLTHNGCPLHVIGVDFPMHDNANHYLPRPERQQLMNASAKRAFAQERPAGEAVLCLSHHPDFFPLAAERGAHLTLSGHTHGGQIAIGGHPVFSTYDYMLGHYQISDSHLYVSGGTGHWLPVRYGVPTEVTVITVRAKG